MGLFIGGLIGAMIKYEPGMVFGVVVALILRWMLGRLRRMDVA